MVNGTKSIHLDMLHRMKSRNVFSILLRKCKNKAMKMSCNLNIYVRNSDNKSTFRETKVTHSSQLVERGSIKLKVLTNNQLSGLPSLKHKRCKKPHYTFAITITVTEGWNSFSALHKQITALLLSNTKFRKKKRNPSPVTYNLHKKMGKFMKFSLFAIAQSLQSPRERCNSPSLLLLASLTYSFFVTIQFHNWLLESSPTSSFFPPFAYVHDV